MKMIEEEKKELLGLKKRGNNIMDKVLALLKRAIPGTTSIDNCEKFTNCMEKEIRICGDIKNLCIRCFDEGKVIGGLAFPLGINLDLGRDVKNPIIIYRYGEAESYATAIKGENFDNILEKFEKDEVLKEITEKTKFIRDEQKEIDNLKKIEAFKRSDTNILVTRKNSKGEYDDLDLKLIEIAKKKEEMTGIKIKIVEETEIDRRVCILGITSKNLIKKLELEAKTICDADDRVFVLVLPGKKYGKYDGLLAISSIEDDILGEDSTRIRFMEYFLNKYRELHFIGTETYKLQTYEYNDNS